MYLLPVATLEDGGIITALTNKDQTSTHLKVKCKYMHEGSL